MRFASLAVIALASSLAACGGKAIADEFDKDSGAPADTGGTTTTDSTTPDDGGGSTDGSPGDTIVADAPKPTADTCKKFVGGICNDKTEACCKTAGFPYDKDACNTGLDFYCNALVDEVTLGRATYNESYLDACVKGWEANLTKCEVDGLESARNQIPCVQLFNGKIKLGEACKGNRYAECEAPPNFGAYCDIKPGAKEGRCRAYGFVGPGEGCNYTGTTVRYCNPGFYCDITSPTATCKPSKKLGDACLGADDYSCGFTARCNDTTFKCEALAAEGATCTVNEQCLSYECAAGKCTKATEPVASKWMCTGSM